MRKLADILLVKAAILIVVQFYFSHSFSSVSDERVAVFENEPSVMLATVDATAETSTNAETLTQSDAASLPLKQLAGVRTAEEPILPVEPPADSSPVLDAEEERLAIREDLSVLVSQLRAIGDK